VVRSFGGEAYERQRFLKASQSNTDKQLRDFQQRIFGQDIMILLNQVPKGLPLDPRHETPVRADALSSAYRRWIKARNVTFGTAR